MAKPSGSDQGTEEFLSDWGNTIGKLIYILVGAGEFVDASVGSRKLDPYYLEVALWNGFWKFRFASEGEREWNVRRNLIEDRLTNTEGILFFNILYLMTIWANILIIIAIQTQLFFITRRTTWHILKLRRYVAIEAATLSCIGHFIENIWGLGRITWEESNSERYDEDSNSNFFHYCGYNSLGIRIRLTHSNSMS